MERNLKCPLLSLSGVKSKIREIVGRNKSNRPGAES